MAAEDQDWEPESPWRTVLRLILEPVPKAHAVWGTAVSVPLAAVIFGFIARSVVAGILLLLLALLGLTFYAAVRLQRRLTDLEFIDFDAVPGINGVGDLQAHTRLYVGGHNLGLWITLQNFGRGADFSAHIDNVQGVPADWGNPYRVHAVAWESSLGKVEHLVRRERANLRFAAYARSLPEHEFWFWIPASATYGMGGHGQGYQWIKPSGTITFDLYVVNITYDKTKRWEGRITFQGTDITEFTLTDPSPRDEKLSRRQARTRDRLQAKPR